MTRTPQIDRILDRAALWIGVAACVGFALVAGWGLARPFGTGHYGWTIATLGSDAEAMIKWKIPASVGYYLNAKPLPSAYYCDHPWGLQWIMVVFIGLFGHHDWAINLPAFVVSAITIALIFSLARHVWGPIPAAAASLGFAVLPITLAYSDFYSLEILVMLGWALFFWGHARMLATGQLRYTVASLGGVFITGIADWQGYIAMAALLAWGMIRAYVLPARWSPPFPRGRYAQWWALSVAIAVATAGMWIWFFFDAGKIAEWLGSATMRRGATSGTLSSVLEARRYLIDMTFTPFAIWLGKVALPIALARFFLLRRDEEAYSLSVLLAATFQYVVFKEGADIHVFWPHTFGMYFALALAQMTATAMAGVRALGRFLPSTETAARGVGLTLALSVVACLPDGLREMAFCRMTGGRFGGKSSDTDSTVVLQHLEKDWPQDATVVAHSSMGWARHHMWTVHRVNETTGALPVKGAPVDEGRPVFLFRRSGITLGDAQRLASSFKLMAYEDIWVIDRRQPPGPIEGFALEEREPNALEWYLYGGFEPMRTVVPDPYLTWELRDELGQPEPTSLPLPKTPRDLRIAYNIAVRSGNEQAKASLRAQIDHLFMPQSATEFTSGARIVGVRHIEGVEPRLEVWFEAPGPLACDPALAVRASIVRPIRFSLIEQEPSDRDLSPLMQSTKSWRAGFLYAVPISLFKRPAVERYLAAWGCREPGTPPTRPDGQAVTELLRE